MRQTVMANLTSKTFRLVLAASLVGVTFSCTSDDEDETALEMTDPVESAEAAKTEESAAPAAPAEVVETAPTPVSPPPAPNPSDVVESTPAPAQPPTVPPPASANSANRRVMYVKTDGVKVHAQADVKSKVVGQMNRGDHILVDIEGPWAKTHDGHYIAMSVLSEKGVARSKKKGAWSGSNGARPQKGKSNSKKPADAPVPAEDAGSEAP